MYGWTYPKEEICFSLGIIPALYTLVDLLLGDYDYAIINTPAYGYSQHPIDERHKHAIHNKLKCDAQGNWTIDFDALEKDAPIRLPNFLSGAIHRIRRDGSGQKKNSAR